MAIMCGVVGILQLLSRLAGHQCPHHREVSAMRLIAKDAYHRCHDLQNLLHGSADDVSA
jgi:hypothetical protein